MDTWEPPSEAEMKLIQARRERSDKISKLMSSYLLKGYKMLGVVCAECDTILLQDRQGTNYCVACSELDSDTDKDNPVTNQSAAVSMAREIELAASGTSSQPKGAISNSTSNMQSQRVQESFEDTCDTTQTLSMSSIDVQSWPSNPESIINRDQAAAAAQSLDPPSVQADSDSGFHSLSCDHQQSSASPRLTAKVSSSQSPCIERLCEKVEWASKELKSTPSVEYSIQLCQLIKTAAEAVVAVRNARI